MSLVELIVAMSIFLVVIAVFMGSVVAMTRTTARAGAVSTATSDVRKVLDRFDKQVRYSTAINRPGSGGTTTKFYVEYLMPNPAAGGTPVCVQWRYDSVAHTIARRSWLSTGAPSATWSAIAVHVRNAMPSNPPFVFTAADGYTVHQGLTVALDVGVGSRPGANARTTYGARNTSGTTQTNQDAPPSDGQSDNPVCLPVGGRL